MKNHACRIMLVLLFILLIIMIVPAGCVFGSNTDWLSQHVTLAETIRDTCLSEHTLLPSWINLGSGSNGYQFAYYGFLRPDILIGCLFPQIPMLWILTGYMLVIFLASCLLCFSWLKSEHLPAELAFLGSVLFMTAGCLFHMHRQVMFVNYLPFLLLAFLCIKKRRFRWIPLCLLLICLSSFYFSISAFAAAGWYWYRTQGRRFWREDLLKRYVPSVLCAVCMAAVLLIPTALVLLEHGRKGTGFSFLTLLELLGPNVAMNNLLFNEYGLGLTFLCLYAILAGLQHRTFRKNSILFLLLSLFGIFSWILNGTLYARPKILIPFLPLIILHCVRCLYMAGKEFSEDETSCCTKENQLKKCYPLWPFAVIFPISLLWFSQEQFFWILADAGLLFTFCMLKRRNRRSCEVISNPAAVLKQKGITFLTLILLLTAPIGLCLTTAGKEDWVKLKDTAAGFSKEELSGIPMDPLYHFDSMVSPLVSGNELPRTEMPRSTMYSSVTNPEYSSLYYDTLLTPVRINNRVALLTSSNPFMLYQLGVRYLETTEDEIPAGYKVIFRSGETVLAENENVLPSVYFTSGKPDPEPDQLSPYTPEFSTTKLPDGLDIHKTAHGYEIFAEKTCTVKFSVENPVPGNVVLLQFQVKNLTSKAVVIDINNIRNKLSGWFAPYPNGNDCFHYQFSPGDKDGPSEFTAVFSKGHYRLEDIRWNLYDCSGFSEEKFTPLAAEAAPETDRTSLPGRLAGTPHRIISGTIQADSDGILATTIPRQNGLEILVDGKSAKLFTVNEAFAGTKLSAGTHRIEIQFTPPGKTEGLWISFAAVIGYICFLVFLGIRGSMEKQKK